MLTPLYDQLKKLPWPTWVIYLAVHLVAGSWLALGVISQVPPPPPWAIGLWSLGWLVMLAAPVMPVIGLMVYVCFAYLVQRYHSQIDFELYVRTLDVVCVLAGVSLLAWLYRHGPHRRDSRHLLTLLMTALVIWIGLTSTAGVLRGRPWQPVIEHHPVFYFHALAMFMLASRWLGRPRVCWVLAMVLCLSLSIRGRLLSPDGVWLQEDIASLLVIALPLALLGIRATRSWWVRAVFVLLIANQLLLLNGTQNRGAAVAMGVTLLVIWALMKHKWITLAAATPLLIVAAVKLVTGSYWQRFADLWQGGRASQSAQERLAIWRAGWHMFLDHPFLGVGPGHFSRYVQAYGPDLRRDFAAHNHLVAMAAETGVIGLMLYGVLFLAALIALAQTAENAKDTWPGPAAKMVLAGLCAYLTVGCFLTRHDMVLAYILVGWAVALQKQLSRPPGTPGTPEMSSGDRRIPPHQTPPTSPGTGP